MIILLNRYFQTIYFQTIINIGEAVLKRNQLQWEEQSSNFKQVTICLIIFFWKIYTHNRTSKHSKTLSEYLPRLIFDIRKGKNKFHNI